jgi:hypothetical protein
MKSVMGRVAGIAIVLGAMFWSVLGTDHEPPPPPDSGTTAWVDSFDLSTCTWSAQGKNPYFVLEPGHQIVLGKWHGKRSEQVLVTVLKDTEYIDGVETRVVEERDFKNGKLREISRNFYAICEERNDVYYFGEDVDIYKKGKIIAHSGAWRAGRGDARPGLMMPGTPRAGLRHYQEMAPGVAMDRAEIRRSDDVCKTPAGTFPNCLQVIETSPLEPHDVGLKRYAPGIGIIQDEDLMLIRYGRGRAGQMVQIPPPGPRFAFLPRSSAGPG